MFEAYTVAVKVALVDNVSSGLLGLSDIFKKLNLQIDRLQRRLEKLKLSTAGLGDQNFIDGAIIPGAVVGSGIRRTKGRDFTTGTLFGMAGAIGAPLGYAITKAAELQQHMVGIQIATHATNAEMDKMRVSIEASSVPTKFSALQMAAVAQKVATSNSFTASQLSGLMPSIAKFVDVQSLLKGTSPMDSAVNAVQIMHLAQKYSPAQAEAYFNEITKVSLMMPGGVGELRSGLSYFQPVAKEAFGIDDQHSLMLVALASRLGLKGSRGGTNLLAAVTRTIPGIFGSGLLHGKSHDALNDMGFIDKNGHSKFMVNGKFNVDKWVMGLSSFVASAIAKDPLHGRERVAIDMQHAFGTQGSKVAALFSSPAAIAQLVSMNYDFNQLANMGVIQDTFVKKSVSQQFQSSLTNLQNIFIELGYNLLPLTLRVLKNVNHELGIFIPWMRAHKTEITELSKDFIKLGASLALAGVVTLFGAALDKLTNPILVVILGIQLLYHEFGQIADAIEGLNKIGWKNVGKAIVQKYGYSGDTASEDAQFSVFYHDATRQKTTQVHHHYLDGKQIASSTISHMTKSAGHAPAHGSSFNSSMGLGYNMLNIGQ